ncbi:membrane-fusion protein [Neoasaia chiangmaiensis NBRC 101099]|uniref:Uncharacterized protein n=1 Tax=Neoasaia chiangmaiensis TaxID=320497 RepID=A0A1U9KS68_9PROT|nr:efflux RND transporter periplasmic adaptor subunit [Neoasaia chiangmaiensis]AQS88559.1 hypothetical protein A0U93_12110 [Neoasaia chiangmaiensis]GBR36301.1 membrane-fusion protein [Neoasaia chiangmaiensis NBRC 101099]GEN15395.1 secretion protein HlyD [Neoasaia chiangmaiensis]
MTASRRGAAFLALSLLVAPHAIAQETWPSAPITIAADALKTEGIETGTARPGRLPPHIDAPAYVALDERRVVRIRPVGFGRVRSVEVSTGEPVKRGQVLLTYDDFSLSDQKQRLLSAEAALQQAGALEKEASLAYSRARTLQGGAVSAGEAHRRLSRLQDARGLVQQREAMLQNERERMARFSSRTEQTRGILSTVVSPIDGVVRRISVTAGEEVSSGAQPPVEVDDLSKVWVISQIDEADASELTRNSRQLTWFRPDRPPIESRIDIIEGSVDPATRHVLVRSLIPNDTQALRPDMLVRTRLFAAGDVGGQLVPAIALQTIGEKPCLFVRTGADQYVARHVGVGPTLEGETVITSGLKSGETVVTKGSFILKSQALLSPAPDHPRNAG